MGELMVRQEGYAAAARYLDNSEQQVREAYQHIEAAERADMATDALSNTDRRVRRSDEGKISSCRSIYSGSMEGRRRLPLRIDWRNIL
jgi:hypothetical protein